MNDRDREAFNLGMRWKAIPTDNEAEEVACYGATESEAFVGFGALFPGRSCVTFVLKIMESLDDFLSEHRPGPFRVRWQAEGSEGPESATLGDEWELLPFDPTVAMGRRDGDGRWRGAGADLGGARDWAGDLILWIEAWEDDDGD